MQWALRRAEWVADPIHSVHGPFQITVVHNSTCCYRTQFKLKRALWWAHWRRYVWTNLNTANCLSFHYICGIFSPYCRKQHCELIIYRMILQIITWLKSPTKVRTVITARKRSLGQGNIFTPVCHSVHRGGMRGCSGWGACVVAPGGHAWLLWGGHAWLLGGHAWLLKGVIRGCSGGACVVALGGVHGCSGGACVVLFGGGACFYSGGIRGFIQGGMRGFIQGGHAWFFQFFRIQWDTVNERAVRILLECILVISLFSYD